MWRRIALCASLAVTTCTFVACDGSHGTDAALARTPRDKEKAEAPAPAARPVPAAARAIGHLLAGPTTAFVNPSPARPRAERFFDTIVVPEARLAVFRTQDVPSQRDGIIEFIGTEITKGMTVPSSAVVEEDKLGELTRKYFKLKEGQMVAADQMMAMLDDRLLREEVASKQAKVSQAEAEQRTSVKTREEAYKRYRLRQRLWEQNAGGGIAIAKEDLDGAKLTWERYVEEAIAKGEAIIVAKRELAQANTQLSMYAIRSKIPGRIRAIKRHPGEFVKTGDTVFQVYDYSRLRIEAMVDQQYRDRVKEGMTVEVENAQWDGPQKTLPGHQGAVTAVAVSNDSEHPLIVSASDDNTAWVWAQDAKNGWVHHATLWHGRPVRAVACTPPGAKHNWCVTGDGDGTIRLWDLDKDGKEPLRVFEGGHRQAVTSLAFSEDGTKFVSGGEDYDIYLWDCQAVRPLYRFPEAHRNTITALQFVPGSRLVSVGTDHTVRLWKVGDQAAEEAARPIGQRSGEVGQLGASPDGKYVLVDKGSALQIVSLPDGLSKGVINNSARAQTFKTFALYAPNGRLVVTAGAPDGRLQLWRTPTNRVRASEVKELVPGDTSGATCAAFAPDGSFLVTGTRDRHVIVWSVPQGADAKPLTAEVTYVEPMVEATARRVKVWAELDNPDGRLTPGTSVTLVIPTK